MTEYFAKFLQLFAAPREDEKGATAVEYGLMVALIAVVVLVAVGPLGTAISTMFVNVQAAL
jgi:pilus assembly protein Flp/PilA